MNGAKKRVLVLNLSLLLADFLPLSLVFSPAPLSFNTSRQLQLYVLVDPRVIKPVL